jgi:hypothetical protein
MQKRRCDSLWGLGLICKQLWSRLWICLWLEQREIVKKERCIVVVFGSRKFCFLCFVGG